MKGSLLLISAVLGVLAAGKATTSTVEELRALSAGAIQKLDDAHRAAVASGRWEDLVRAGDAYRRLGEPAGQPEAFDAKAREAYRSALARARHDESLDGVLRVAEALATVADREAVGQAFRIADRLAALDPDARADVRAFAARFADQLDGVRE
ncbi:MAG: hypothetical protein ACRELA_02500 [Candidatus Rokuibacteriota bacterium]